WLRPHVRWDDLGRGVLRHLGVPPWELDGPDRLREPSRSVPREHRLRPGRQLHDRVRRMHLVRVLRARLEHVGVSQRHVGGALADTWNFTGGNWTSLTSSLTVSPPKLAYLEMAFDPLDGYTIAFGGQY